MKKGLLFIIILFVIVGFGGCKFMKVQNTLVGKDENVKAKWAEVQNQYQRRADLIPNLVNTIKGAANFEQKTLTDVINARAKATSIQVNADDLSPEKLREFQSAQGELSQALGRLMVVTENYPELKANQNFLALQDQLEGTENRTTVARKNFNESVQDYNTYMRSFPNSLFAGFLNFKEKGSFSADAGAQNAPS